MGRTRDLFKKTRDTKGTFYAKMGTIKDRNGMDLTEAEDIKKSDKNTEKDCTKKELHDPDNHDGVITHLDQISWNVKSSGLNQDTDSIPGPGRSHMPWNS